MDLVSEILMTGRYPGVGVDFPTAIKFVCPKLLASVSDRLQSSGPAKAINAVKKHLAAKGYMTPPTRDGSKCGEMYQLPEKYGTAYGNGPRFLSVDHARDYFKEVGFLDENGVEVTK